MKILITGGAGFIGSNLVKKLEKENEVVVLDNFSTGKREYLSNCKATVINGDLRNKELVLKATKDIEVVIHLAAHTSVIESIENPSFDFENNVIGTLNLLEASFKNKVEKFIFDSYNAVIGDPLYVPIDEKHPVKPKSPYGASKLAAEGYCTAFAEKGLHTVILRFANVYGINMDNKTSVIPLFINRILNHEPPIIYGDGNQTRDFIHVQDIVESIILSIENGKSGSIYQIGTQVETSINELCQYLLEISGSDLNPIYKPKRKGEIKRNYSMIQKAKQELGYDPSVYLREGLKEVFEYFRTRI
ncbi:MAG: NAD-dependent epimerase/dehydratase family protein [Methanosarcinales archaeon]